jgi:hypothetical protein
MTPDLAEDRRTSRRGGRAVVVVGALSVATLALTGCTPTPVDQEAVNRWVTAHDAAEHEPDVLGVLSGRVDAGPGGEDVSGDVRITFSRPAQLSVVEFSCFGDGTIAGTVVTTAGSRSFSTGFDAVTCSDGPQRVPLGTSAREDIDEVAFAAGDSSRDGAWQLAVHGAGGRG